MARIPQNELREITSCGCAAKLPPGELARALEGLQLPADDHLLVGLEHPDDAGVYRITEDLAMIQTVDFFTQVVDDPYQFGMIAAANAMSDIYAMGGVAKTALNIVAFPLGMKPLSVLRQILEGGSEKMREAGVALLGGHSIQDKELKYGLAVTGFITPSEILTKKAISPGDRLILTKPLGTGIITTAMKAGMVPGEVSAAVIHSMTRLNKSAAEAAGRFPVHACTDVTGFGLLGHLSEMVDGSGLCARIDADKLPIFQGAVEFAGMGLMPAATHRNREFRDPLTSFAPSAGRFLPYVCFDPQTSGGLLISVPEVHSEALLEQIKEGGDEAAAIIGEIVPGPNEKIVVS
jgi:selenide,water dikinase